MSSAAFTNCRKGGCSNRIPPGLSAERLCLDHFLDEAFVRTEQSLEACQKGLPLDPEVLEWILSDALAVVKSLEENADPPNPSQRDRMLELLLIIANLHEYLAHHSVELQRPA
jgi:hypothetical protein